MAVAGQKAKEITIHFHCLTTPEFLVSDEKENITLTIYKPFQKEQQDAEKVGEIPLVKQRIVNNEGYARWYGHVIYEKPCNGLLELMYYYSSDVVGDEYFSKEGLSRRVLRIEEKDAVWHQFDYVVHAETYDPCENVESIVAPGNKITREQRDFQLVMLTYLPCWTGFEDSSPEEPTPPAWITSSPDDAKQMVDQVMHCMKKNEILCQKKNTNYVYLHHKFDTETYYSRPKNFDTISKEVFMHFVTTRLDMLNQSDHNGLYEAIFLTQLLQCRHVQGPYFSSKEHQRQMCKILQFPLLNQDHCNQLLTDIQTKFATNNRFGWYNLISFIQQVPDECMDWLRVLPLIHFLRMDIDPCQDVKQALNDLKEINNLRFWGVHELDKKCNRISEDLCKELVPLFQIDKLLPRALVWIHLTPGDIEHLSRFDVPPELICCGILYIFNSKIDVKTKKNTECLETCLSTIVKDIRSKQSRETLQKSLKIPSELLLNTFLQKLEKEQWKLVCLAIDLLAVSGSSLDCAMSDGIAKWLERILPNQITGDGEKHTFDREPKLWNDLLKSCQHFDEEISRSLVNVLEDIFKKRVTNIRDYKHQVLLFCTSESYEENFRKILQDKAFPALEKALEKEENVFFFRTVSAGLRRPKFGALLSEMIVKSIPNPGKKYSYILSYSLSWSPLIILLGLQETVRESLLTQEAASRLDIVKDALQLTLLHIIHGTVTLHDLETVTKRHDVEQFLDLQDALKKSTKDSDGDKRLHGADDIPREQLRDLMNQRKLELDFIIEEKTANEVFLMCCSECGVDEVHENTQKARDSLDKLQFKDVVKSFVKLQNVTSVPVKPEGTVFNHPLIDASTVKSIAEAYKSKIFSNRLIMKSRNVKQHLTESRSLSVEVFYTHVWQSVQSSLKSSASHLSEGTLPVDRLKEILPPRIEYYKSSELKDEIKKVFNIFNVEVGDQTLDKRIRQIVYCFKMKNIKEVTDAYWQFKEGLHLEGNFNELDFMKKNMQSQKQDHEDKEEAPGSKIQELSETVIKTCDLIENRILVAPSSQIRRTKPRTDFQAPLHTELTKDLLHHMKLLNQQSSSDLIKWIREKIKDVEALDVFVDLASEIDDDFSNLLAFHDVVTCYAPLIFLDEKKSTLETLIVASLKCIETISHGDWNQQKNDAARKQWTKISNLNKWLKQVHEAVGISPLKQAETINDKGVYILGNNADSFPSTLNIKNTTTRERLLDLESKLSLVAGREQMKTGEHVEYFTMVLDAVQQIEDTSGKLCRSGNTLFLDWGAVLPCDFSKAILDSTEGKTRNTCYAQWSQDSQESEKELFFGIDNWKLVTSGSLCDVLFYLQEFMDGCLKDWEQDVASKRDRYYYLNFFTTEQLLFLSKALAKYKDIKEKEPVEAARVHALLSQVCTTTSWETMSESILTAITGATEAVMESQTVDTKGKQFDDTGSAKWQQIKSKAAYLADMTGQSETLFIAAIKHFDDNTELEDEDYVDWCMDRSEDDQSNVDQSSTTTWKESTSKKLQKLQKEKKPLKDQLKDLWTNYLDDVRCANSKEYLSLEYVGHILEHLAQANPDTNVGRHFPEELLEDVPNLVVCPSGKVLPTVLAIYEDGPMPAHGEVLCCTQETTLEEVLLICRRASSTRSSNNSHIYCLINADLLDYKTSEDAAKYLQTASVHRFLIMCSSERKQISHLVAALDRYRVEFPDRLLAKANIAKYILQHFQQKAKYDAVGQITANGTNIEVIVSERAGVGKSLYVQRYSETFNMHTTAEHVIVALRNVRVDYDYVVKVLQPHVFNPKNEPRIFHLDVAPMVKEGLDHLLFNLLILGGLTDSRGWFWKCANRDLYVVEITDPRMRTREKGSARPFYTYLPQIVCNSPRELCNELTQSTQRDRESTTSSNIDEHSTTTAASKASDGLLETKITESHTADSKAFQPQIDEIIFEEAFIQRPFNYLVRLDRDDGGIEHFDFSKTPQYSNFAHILQTLLKHCGVVDPSWVEITHFAHFLDKQLQDCEKSPYTNIVGGFKTFVAKFMTIMAMDFTTHSLCLTDQSTTSATAQLSTREYDLSTGLSALGGYQIKRKWESSSHPFIFFNGDHETFTFLGFVIDDFGSLLNSNTREVVHPYMVDRNMNFFLKKSGVDFDTPFNTKSRQDMLKDVYKILMPAEKYKVLVDPKLLKDIYKMLMLAKKYKELILQPQSLLTDPRVCALLEVFDPDVGYKLNSDNVQKILAIHMRFSCGIPVVIMGETGCGKTWLIRFMCRLLAAKYPGKAIQNMVQMKVHGGTVEDDIIEKLVEAEKLAVRNYKLYNVDTVLFLDEANTSETIGLIKEMICDGRINGRKIITSSKGLKIIAACNPYKRLSDVMIENMKRSGQGYHVSSEETQEKFGSIPLRELVYRVRELPPSLLPLVWDFGQMDSTAEHLYIDEIVKQHVNEGSKIASGKELNVITGIFFVAQRFMRDQQNECSFVSLRDVRRCVKVLRWFWKQTALREYKLQGDITRLVHSLVLALGVCYHARLQKQRSEFRDAISKAFKRPVDLPNGSERFLDLINGCQDKFLAGLELGPNIARNAALKENIFMMVVCIELGIPLFLVGKPGSSKSLAKAIVSKSMKGTHDKSIIFNGFKRVHMVSYQCSPLSTSEGIIKTFERCKEYQRNKDPKHFVSVVVLDEVGLAEDSPNMPLKTLHPLLESGSIKGDEETEVAFIGLSNWALDPAKMNRGIMVSREDPNEEELIKTARGICSSGNTEQVLGLITDIITQLAKAYLQVYKETCQPREFFGLRDYYSLIKMVYHYAQDMTEYGHRPTIKQLEYCVRRNFSGLLKKETHSEKEINPWKTFQSYLKGIKLPKDGTTTPDCSPAGLLKDSINGVPKIHGDNRYLLVITENYSALPMLQHNILSQPDAIVVFGSSFPKDQKYTEICRNICKVKTCIEMGHTAILLNLENMYESLYDALNQYYVHYNNQRYVDLGLGTHRVKCKVHKKTRLVVVVVRDRVQKLEDTVLKNILPMALNNRLEKHILDTTTMLTDSEKAIVNRLKKWVHLFAKINLPRHEITRAGYEFTKFDAFPGYHSDMIPTLVFQVCSEMEQHDGDYRWRDLIVHKVKDMLLNCATPEAVIRLKCSKIDAIEGQALYRTYFNEQHHQSLEEYLRHRIIQNESGKAIMAQVTTHSPLVVSEDHLQHLADSLQLERRSITNVPLLSIQTQQEFRERVRMFLQNNHKKERLLLLHCLDGNRNRQLIACALYCIQDEVKQASKKYHDYEIKPAHVVLVINLSRTNLRYASFLGGPWDLVHIDDVIPVDQGHPSICKLQGVSLSSIFQSPKKTDGFADDMTPSLLIKSSLIKATSFISDIEECSDRSSRRIAILRSLLDSPSVGNDSFLTVIISRLGDLLSEKEVRNPDASGWLYRFALLVSAIHESGTYRRATWQHLVNDVCPLLGELLAYCDYDDNLSIAKDNPQDSWQHQLWIAILKDKDISVLHYQDFLSSSSNRMRAKAIVRRTGSGKRLFSASIPFSWLIKDFVEKNLGIAATLAQLHDSYTSKTNAVVAKETQRLLQNSNLGKTLEHHVPREKYNQFMSSYTEDFVRMVYAQDPNKDEVTLEGELECVLKALSAARQTTEKEIFETPGKDIVHGLVALHMAYHRVERRLEHFSLLIKACPQLLTNEAYLEKLKDQNYKEQEGPTKNEMTLDAKAVHILVSDILVPNRKKNELEHVKQKQWLQRVQSIKVTIQHIMQSGLAKRSYCAYDSSAVDILQQARYSWYRIRVLELFLLHVCLHMSPSADKKISMQMANWVWLSFKPSTKAKCDTGFKSKTAIQNLEKCLKKTTELASKTDFKYGIGETCSLCMEKLTDPVDLPCGHVFCEQCTVIQLQTQRTCPYKCHEPVPEDFCPASSKNKNKKAMEDFTQFKRHRNAFFLSVVMQLCFEDGSPPDEDVFMSLLKFVTGHESNGSGSQVTFNSEYIDMNPEVQMVILQLLFRTRNETVCKYVAQHLEDQLAQRASMQKFEADKDLNLCLMFIYCIEEQCFHDARMSGSAEHKAIDAKEKLENVSQVLLQSHKPKSIQELFAVAEARFVLILTAQLLYEQTKQTQVSDCRSSQTTANELIEKARVLCEALPRAHHFLVMQICNTFGISCLSALSRSPEYRWILPEEFESEVVKVPDHFIVCGPKYMEVRNMLRSCLQQDTLEGILNVLEDKQEADILLTIFREITLSYADDKGIPASRVRPQLESFIKSRNEKGTFLRKKFALRLIVNQLFGPEGRRWGGIRPEHSLRHQMFVALIVHVIVAVHCARHSNILHPLKTLLQDPEKMKQSFLPTMPNDDLKAIHEAIAGTWYECKNGHLYNVGGCGNPVSWAKCIECGTTVGNRLSIMNRVMNIAFWQAPFGSLTRNAVDPTTRRYFGHIIDDASKRPRNVIPERGVSATAFTILRMILHSVMIGAVIDFPVEIKNMISPRLEEEESVGEFFWQHLEVDFKQLVAVSGKSDDDCIILVHLILQRILEHAEDDDDVHVEENLLHTEKDRNEWELKFIDKFVNPTVKNIPKELESAQSKMRIDDLYTNNKLNKFLDEKPSFKDVQLQDLKQIAKLPVVWQHRPHISVHSLQHYLEAHPESKTKHELLDVFLQKVHLLRALRYLPDIVHLHSTLIDVYGSSIDPSEAKGLDIEEFIQEKEDRQKLVDSFIEAWNEVHEYIPTELGGMSQACQVLCYQPLDKSGCKLSRLLPSNTSEGTCSRFLALLLIRTQNDFISTYQRIRNLSLSEPRIQPRGITRSHLVAFDVEKEFLPTIRTHCHCDLETNEQTYNLEELERDVEDNFVRGRPILSDQVDRLKFRDEYRSEAVFSAIREELPQETLSYGLKKDILAELTPLSVLCDCLKDIEIAIGFLASSPANLDNNMVIKTYLQQYLSFPEQKLQKLKSKAYHSCRLKHVLSLWQVLAVARAKERFVKNQEPIENVNQEFLFPLEKEEQKVLREAFPRLDIDRFIEQLYEYIELNLKSEVYMELDIASWGVVDVLSVECKDIKDEPEIRGLQYISNELRLSKAVSIWKEAVKHQNNLHRRSLSLESIVLEPQAPLYMEGEADMPLYIDDSFVYYTRGESTISEADSLIQATSKHSEKYSATIDHKGGQIIAGDTGACLKVPKGAIPEGESVEISVSLHWGLEYPFLEGNQMAIGPAVHCEPNGMKFRKPITLTIPHSAENISEKHLKVWTLTTGHESNMCSNWQVFYDGNNEDTAGKPTVSVSSRKPRSELGTVKIRTDHFSWYTFILSYFFGNPVLNMEMLTYMHPTKILKDTQHVLIKMYVVRKDEIKKLKEVEIEEDLAQGGKCATRRPLQITPAGKDITFKMEDITPRGGWTPDDPVENVRIQHRFLQLGGLASTCTAKFTKENSEVAGIAGFITGHYGDEAVVTRVPFADTMIKPPEREAGQDLPPTPTTSEEEYQSRFNRQSSAASLSSQSSRSFPDGGAAGYSPISGSEVSHWNTSRKEIEFHQQVLNKSTDLLCGHLELRAILLKLKTFGVLDDDDVRDIKSTPRKADRVDRLLELLREMDHKAYERFMEALESVNEDLHREVKAIETRIREESLPRQSQSRQSSRAFPDGGATGYTPPEELGWNTSKLVPHPKKL